MDFNELKKKLKKKFEEMIFSYFKEIFARLILHKKKA